MTKYRLPALAVSSPTRCLDRHHVPGLELRAALCGHGFAVQQVPPRRPVSSPHRPSRRPCPPLRQQRDRAPLHHAVLPHQPSPRSVFPTNLPLETSTSSLGIATLISMLSTSSRHWSLLGHHTLAPMPSHAVLIQGCPEESFLKVMAPNLPVSTGFPE